MPECTGECGRHVRLPSVEAKSDQGDGGKKRARTECDKLQAPEQVELLSGATPRRRRAVVAFAFPIRHSTAHSLHHKWPFSANTAFTMPVDWAAP